MTEESSEHRLERLKFRSWRRGFRELDLILGPWADENVAKLNNEDLDAYEAILAAADWDVFYWITQNRQPDPEQSESLIKRLSDYAARR